VFFFFNEKVEFTMARTHFQQSTKARKKIATPPGSGEERAGSGEADKKRRMIGVQTRASLSKGNRSLKMTVSATRGHAWLLNNNKYTGESTENNPNLKTKSRSTLAGDKKQQSHV